MYAIVKIAGKQFRVEENKTVKVPYLNIEDGGKVEFDHIMLYNDKDGKTSIGSPLVEKVKVFGTVISNDRDKKIIVFKKKRRKGYQKKNGHRQWYTKVQIDAIGAKAPKKAAKAAKAKKETKEA